MAFEQATIKVVKEREFGELRTIIEQVLAPDRVVKFLKALESRGFLVRDLDGILAAKVIDSVADTKVGAAESLYGSLPVSDQAQLREFYLSRIEEVDSALRVKFRKVYQYS
ncbi:MAG TPA: hypothetical protein VL983_00690 [Terriglobales bacterium]|nr:hypothetical protein [Terriglobales bacterium]